MLEEKSKYDSTMPYHFLTYLVCKLVIKSLGSLVDTGIFDTDKDEANPSMETGKLMYDRDFLELIFPVVRARCNKLNELSTFDYEWTRWKIENVIYLEKRHESKRIFKFSSNYIVRILENIQRRLINKK